MKKKWKTVLGFLLTAALCLTACGTSSFKDEAVLRIDDREIMKSEYMVYLYTTTKTFLSAAGEEVWNMDFDGQTADELMEERTISTIQSVIAAKEYAADNGIALTEEQKAEAELAAENFIASVSPDDLKKMGVDAKQIVPMMEDSYLYALVSQEIAAECEVDAADMADYYQKNKDLLKEEYTSLKLQSIVTDDAEKAAEAADQAKAGEDFAALFAEYDVDPQAENNGEMMLSQKYLQNSFGLSESLEVGDVAGPLQMGDGYFILKVLEKTVPTEVEVQELAENIYRTDVQAAYMEARFSELTKNQKVEKIETVWEALEKFH